MVMFLMYLVIVMIYQVGVVGDGCLYLVMEYCLCLNLQICLCKEFFLVVEVLCVGIQVVGVVEIVYWVGVLYCDIKFVNIFVMEYNCLVFIDFGIVFMIGVIGEFLGMLILWLLLELFVELLQSGLCIDVWVLGVMFYMLLVGCLLFECLGECNFSVDLIECIEWVVLFFLVWLDLFDSLQWFFECVMVKNFDDWFLSVVVFVCVLQKVQIEFFYFVMLIDIVDDYLLVEDFEDDGDGFICVWEIVSIDFGMYGVIWFFVLMQLKGLLVVVLDVLCFDLLVWLELFVEQIQCCVFWLVVDVLVVLLFVLFVVLLMFGDCDDWMILCFLQVVQFEVLVLLVVVLMFVVVLVVVVEECLLWSWKGLWIGLVVVVVVIVVGGIVGLNVLVVGFEFQFDLESSEQVVDLQDLVFDVVFCVMDVVGMWMGDQVMFIWMNFDLCEGDSYIWIEIGGVFDGVVKQVVDEMVIFVLVFLGEVCIEVMLCCDDGCVFELIMGCV